MRVIQNALTDGDQSAVFARGKRSGGAVRQAQLGVLTHAGITNSVGFVNLSEEDGSAPYLWSDNTTVLRISGISTHPGTTSGTVVGDQTSDIRLKKDFKELGYGLSELMQLETFLFQWKERF
jgi:hypothetical protein